MRVANWSPEQVTAEIELEAMNRLELAAFEVADKARQTLKGLLNKPGIVREIAKSGKYAGKAWTARIPGTLMKSIRVVRLKGDPGLNIRVYMGARKGDILTAYYAHMIERGTVKMRAKPCLRPALNRSKAAIIARMGY